MNLTKWIWYGYIIIIGIANYVTLLTHIHCINALASHFLSFSDKICMPCAQMYRYNYAPLNHDVYIYKHGGMHVTYTPACMNIIL